MNTEPEKHHVLIVEDDQMIADSLGTFLQKKGYNTTWAVNGLDGLNKLNENQFDAAIADVMMPEMNGLSFLEKCKADYPELEIIMVTGYSDIKVAIEAMKKGAADFITKPFRFDQVEGTVRALIERKTSAVAGPLNDNIDILNRRLEKKIHELSILYSISEALEAVGDADALFVRLVELAVSITGAGSAAFYLCDLEEGKIYLKSSFEKNGPATRKRELTLPGSAHQMITGNRNPLLFFDPNGLDQYKPFADSNKGLRSLVLASLYVKTEHFGILAVEDKESEMQFSDNDVNFISLLLKKAAIELENNALYESIYNNLVATLRSLVTTLEAKDTYTQRHSDRVTKLSLQIAETMGCSEDELEIIRFAGMLHDIGKIGISDAILQKQGKLTDEEYEIIKTHPQIGSQILEPLCMLPREQEIIRHHHERWDGRGYPDGLNGTDIPFLARIVSLADAYDAMTSDRVYRKALSHEIAVEEIKKNEWHQFDGNIVRAFLTMSERMGSNLIKKAQ